MNIEKTAKAIKEMKVQGAVEISLAATSALEDLVRKSKAKTKQEFLRELHKGGKELIKTRPTAVALPNIINSFVKEVEKTSGDLKNMKKKALQIGNKIMRGTKESVKKIAKNGSKLIKNNSTILIHCHSGTVMNVLKEAHKQGKKFEVICTETRPWHQGFISAKELSNYGIKTTLIVDSAVFSFMNKVDLVLVGADTILKNYKVVNKIGTSQIALVARNFKVPMYVATQKLKFSNSNKVVIEERPKKEIIDPKKLPKVKIRNPVFDITEPSYIKGIITEKGILKTEKKL